MFKSVERLWIGTAAVMAVAAIASIVRVSNGGGPSTLSESRTWIMTLFGIVGLLLVGAVALGILTVRQLGRILDEPEPPKKRDPDVARRLRARAFLPESPPHGWSVPLALRHDNAWHIDTGSERIIALLHKQGGQWVLHVTIVDAREGPVSDARCGEILREFHGVGEFIEGSAMDTLPRARRWLALPNGLKPSWRVPKVPPKPREPELSPHLVAARKYLPQKLPAGWSVPVAITHDHGSEWKDGAWMMGAGDEVMLACLCTSKGRVKLAVTIFRADGSEVSEGTALELLREFHGVLEFVQTDPAEEEEQDDGPRRTTYLGELQPIRGERALLN